VICLSHVLQMAGEFRSAGIPIHVMPKQATFDVRLIASLYRLFRRERVGVVHAFSATAEFFSGVAAKGAGSRFVASIRNFNQPLPALPRAAKRLACRLADAVVANSEAGARSAAESGIAPQARLHVVPNGLGANRVSRGEVRDSVRCRLGWTNEACVTLSVGRLVWEKGYDTLLDMAARLGADRPALRFFIAGDGPLRGHLERRISAEHLESRVTLLGERADIPELLAAADVYLNTSVSEGLSNAVMEAMAAGLPVVATAVGGTPELITDAETGLLFPARDVARGVDLLESLVASPVLRQELGTSARAVVLDRYEATVMVSRMERIYEEILK
jgi:glycosyltransferase involved in cell wall biosynthesis